MTDEFTEEEKPTAEDDLPYHIIVKRSWFRGKAVFGERLGYYSQLLQNADYVELPLNAGNMIYTMLRRLEIGVEWQKQDALIAAYGELMYRMSYVRTVWINSDLYGLHMTGRKGDVLWALSFITQVFPEKALSCKVPIDEADLDNCMQFVMQDGEVRGKDASKAIGGQMPNIWDSSLNEYASQAKEDTGFAYDSRKTPEKGEAFALPDGRVANYVRMDDRYRYAQQYGTKVSSLVRHNITASLIKDLTDIIHRQTQVDYDVYRMRYVALMTKVHELESMLGGLEISAYDQLPIGERGLPYASKGTIRRTDTMDCNSLKYYFDMLQRNKDRLSHDEKERIVKAVAKSASARVKGYDMEYRSYQATGSPEELCKNLHDDACFELYADFAEIEAMGICNFPKRLYAILCNAPENVYQPTRWETHRLEVFGYGYYDFLNYQIQTLTNARQRGIYERALNRLQKKLGNTQ